MLLSIAEDVCLVYHGAKAYKSDIHRLACVMGDVNTV